MTFYQREVLNVGGKYVSILLNRRVFPFKWASDQQNYSSKFISCNFQTFIILLVKFQNVQSIPHFKQSSPCFFSPFSASGDHPSNKVKN